MIYKCKMCGGDIDILENKSLAVCSFCGTKQTVPNIDKEKLIQLYNRGTYLIKNREYDKASFVFEKIIEEDNKQAEAYWGLCLCKYGIEYVTDPKNGIKIPTCHRTIANSIFNDNDFKKTIGLADVVAKGIYQEQANYIDKIQKKIFEISSKEEPYDIFICYKESDAYGERTKDSVIGEDIFDELVSTGYKVFFSRISLEDKVGVEYEPYIYSALTSSKVIIVLGTKSEYFTSPWVMNEWSRFLKFMEKDKNKFLIPCYLNMSPYDMPEEFANLQAQDLGKIGYLKDLCKGISKLIGSKKVEEVKEIRVDDISLMEERIFEINRLIKDDSFYEATDKCEELVSKFPRFAKGYFYVFLLKNGIANNDFINNFTISLTRAKSIRDLRIYKNDENYINARKYADEEFNAYMDEFDKKIKEINDNNKRIEKYDIYEKLLNDKKKCSTIDDYKKIINGFESLGDYQDAQKQAQFYKNKIKGDDYKDSIYKYLVASIRPLMTKSERDKIYEGFKSLGNFKDTQLYLDDYVTLNTDSVDYLKSRFKLLTNKKEEFCNFNDIILGFKEKQEVENVDFESKEDIIKKKYSSIIAELELKILNYEENIIKETSKLDSCGFFDIKEKKRLKGLILKQNLGKSDLVKRKTDTSKILSNELDKIKSSRLAINNSYDEKIETFLTNNKEYNDLENEIKNINESLQCVDENKTGKQNLWEPKLDLYEKDSIGLLLHFIILGKYPSLRVDSDLLKEELVKILPDVNGLCSFNGLDFTKKNNEFYVHLPIQWRCVSKSDLKGKNYYLLISRYGLDFKPFDNISDINDENPLYKKNGEFSCNYEKSELRKFLINDFYNNFFNSIEKSFLVKGLIDNSSATTYDEVNDFYCKNTIDKVFLISCRSFYKMPFCTDIEMLDSYENFKEIYGNALKRISFIEKDSVQSDVFTECDINDLGDEEIDKYMESSFQSEFLFCCKNNDYALSVLREFKNTKLSDTQYKFYNEKSLVGFSIPYNFSTWATRSTSTYGGCPVEVCGDEGSIINGETMYYEYKNDFPFFMNSIIRPCIIYCKEGDSNEVIDNSLFDF